MRAASVAATAWWVGGWVGGVGGQPLKGGPCRQALGIRSIERAMCWCPLCCKTHSATVPPRDQQVVGGYDAVFKALAAALGDTVQLDTPVEEVRARAAEAWGEGYAGSVWAALGYCAAQCTGGEGARVISRYGPATGSVRC